VSFSVSRSGES